MKTEEIRKKFLSFFQKRGHKILPPGPLVPEGDSSVLFNTAGMQPLIPYFLGREHPLGKRLVNFQPCVRTVDIDEVGDATHLTFFEMMGNWSLGDYFKEEAIKWSYELLTSQEEGFGLDPERIYVTVFAGKDNIPKDIQAAEIWKSLGVPDQRIFYLEENWWSPGDNGPCGPDSEMFYDLTPDGLSNLSHQDFIKADQEQKIVEIWNDVFMEYEQKNGQIVGQLKNKNIDTGAGLERLATVLQGKKTVFDTDIFSNFFNLLSSDQKNKKESKILADHLRAVIFLISAGVLPSNIDRGYVLRRLLRRSIRIFSLLNIHLKEQEKIIDVLINDAGKFYPELFSNRKLILETITNEKDKFSKTLNKGLKELEREISKYNKLSAEVIFKLITTYGFPLELVIEEAERRDIKIDLREVNNLITKHKEISKIGSEKKFKSGLADSSDMSVKYHTATHLLHQALREVLGPQAIQKGSNITSERLRFDFAFGRKLTDNEKEEIERRVNEKIKDNLPINSINISKKEAEAMGALGLFDSKYGDMVSVYYIGSDLSSAYSKEFCAGPHAIKTGELGRFKIKKEEAVASGIRRIKAVLE
ncbi:MAG TPA: alanine--tRNA ligase [Candidatus Vogelbacteria bacterium]|nr:alanine--tRNA ligase [Candidatus Vogelbacteria bacterium]